MKVIGILDSASAESRVEELAAFHRALVEGGCVEGQNVTIDYRSAENKYGKDVKDLDTLAEALVRRGVDVLVAAGGPASALAAKTATEKVAQETKTERTKVVFTTVADPVGSGLVASLNEPGGNLTGTAGLTSELDAARLRLLNEIAPRDKPIAVLVNPNRPNVVKERAKLEQTAKDEFKRDVLVVEAGSEKAIGTALEALEGKVGALLATADPLFNDKRAEVVKAVNGLGIPAIYQWRSFVAAGGLMSYGPRIADAYRQAGVYACRILKDPKLAVPPVVRPTVFELAINLKAAEGVDLNKLLNLAARGDLLKDFSVERESVVLSTEVSWGAAAR